MITIKSIKCIGWQQQFAHMFVDLQPNDKLIIKASRQKGKSTILCQGLLYYAVNNPGSESYFISPTNNQCRKQFNDLRKGIAESPLVKKMNESTCEIVFTNQSKINFRSAESGDNLRGNTVKDAALFIDEAAYIRDDTISLLLPYVTVHKCPIIMCSTPRRKSGIFYEFYSKALAGVEHYKYIDVNDYDNSFFITPEQIEDYRSMMSAEKFKNEILGLFSNNDEGVFGDYQSIYYTPETDPEPVYGGIDFSTTGNDATVMSFLNKNKEQCYIWRDKDIKDPVKRCEMMADYINQHPTIKVLVCETNSMGSVYIALLRRLLKNPSIIREYTTTNTTKKDAVENLVKLIGKKEITLLPDKQQDYELSIYISIPLSKGNYTYGNDPKASNGNDDTVAALCLACTSFMVATGQYVIRGR